MEQKINIAEILKDAPKGTKLWSPVYGTLYLLEIRYANDGAEGQHNINAQKDYAILCSFEKYRNDNVIGFDPYGRLFRTEKAETMLFPFENNRKWERYTKPWEHKSFSPFEKVLVMGDKNERNNCVWTAAIFSHIKLPSYKYVTTNGCIFTESSIIPYKGNEDKLGKEVKE